MGTEEARGYSANKQAVLTRLRRLEGQVRVGVEGMVEEDRYCIDIVTQVTAIQAALDKVALELLDDHAKHCVIGGEEARQEERTEELMGAVPTAPARVGVRIGQFGTWFGTRFFVKLAGARTDASSFKT